MAGHWTDEFSFFGGAIQDTRHAYLLAVHDPAAEAKAPQTTAVIWTDGSWHGESFEWSCAGCGIIGDEFIMVGVEGDVAAITPTDIGEENPIGAIGGRSGALTNARAIDRILYVTGMGRRVLRRDGINAWTQLDAGMPAPDDGPVRGLNAIDGAGAQELVAVGWGGEIWAWDGSTWRSIDSPTNLILSAVRRMSDGTYYAVGQEGIVVRGRADRPGDQERWEIVGEAGAADFLYDVIEFDGRVVASSMLALFELKDEALEPFDFGDAEDVPLTQYRLALEPGPRGAGGPGRLWTIGSKDVFRLDGKSWERID